MRSAASPWTPAHSPDAASDPATALAVRLLYVPRLGVPPAPPVPVPVSVVVPAAVPPPYGACPGGLPVSPGVVAEFVVVLAATPLCVVRLGVLPVLPVPRSAVAPVAVPLPAVPLPAVPPPYAARTAGRLGSPLPAALAGPTDPRAPADSAAASPRRARPPRNTGARPPVSPPHLFEEAAAAGPCGVMWAAGT